MRRSEALQGVRMIRLRSALGRYEAEELNQIEAAEMLELSERTFRRWCRYFEDDGEAGLWAARPPGGFHRKTRPGSNASTGPGTRASPRDTSTSIWCRPSVPMELHLDDDVSSIEGFLGEGVPARRSSAQTTAASAAGNDDP
jgi:hypothetical protein